jgi:hypothetical protein
MIKSQRRWPGGRGVRCLKAAGGLWFGWSGEISEEEKPLKK